jgi:hypothetical protein
MAVELARRTPAAEQEDFRPDALPGEPCRPGRRKRRVAARAMAGVVREESNLTQHISAAGGALATSLRKEDRSDRGRTRLSLRGARHHGDGKGSPQVTTGLQRCRSPGSAWCARSLRRESRRSHPRLRAFPDSMGPRRSRRGVSQAGQAGACCSADGRCGEIDGTEPGRKSTSAR